MGVVKGLGCGYGVMRVVNGWWQWLRYTGSGYGKVGSV